MFGCTDWGKGPTCPSRAGSLMPWEYEPLLRRYPWGVIVHSHDKKIAQEASFAVERQAFLDGYYLAFSMSDCALLPRLRRAEGRCVRGPEEGAARVPLRRHRRVRHGAPASACRSRRSRPRTSRRTGTRRCSWSGGGSGYTCRRQKGVRWRVSAARGRGGAWRRRSSRWRWSPGAVALLVLRSAPAPRRPPTARAPGHGEDPDVSGARTYDNPQLRFRVRVPGEWSLRETGRVQGVRRPVPHARVPAEELVRQALPAEAGGRPRPAGLLGRSGREDEVGHGRDHRSPSRRRRSRWRGRRASRSARHRRRERSRCSRTRRSLSRRAACS